MTESYLETLAACHPVPQVVGCADECRALVGHVPFRGEPAPPAPLFHGLEINVAGMHPGRLWYVADALVIAIGGRVAAAHLHLVLIDEEDIHELAQAVLGGNRAVLSMLECQVPRIAPPRLVSSVHITDRPNKLSRADHSL